MSNSQDFYGSPFWLKLLSIYNLHPPTSLRQLPLRTGDDLRWLPKSSELSRHCSMTVAFALNFKVSW